MNDPVLTLGREMILARNDRNSSICWKCAKSCGGKGCPWADSLQPNPEWQEGRVIEKEADDGTPCTIILGCDGFEVEIDKPFELNDARSICLAVSDPSSAKTILKMTRKSLERRMEKYNEERAAAGLPPIVIRPPEEEEDYEEYDTVH